MNGISRLATKIKDSLSRHEWGVIGIMVLFLWFSIMPGETLITEFFETQQKAEYCHHWTAMQVTGDLDPKKGALFFNSCLEK